MTAKRTLGDLNDVLFRELARLEGAEGEDLAMEIDRAKAVQGIANTTISNANTILSALRMQREAEMGVAGAVAVPRGLLGD